MNEAQRNHCLDIKMNSRLEHKELRRTVAGRILTIHPRVGDHVQKGDIVATVGSYPSRKPENGRIVRQGGYTDLVSQPGLFARLASRQTA